VRRSILIVSASMGAGHDGAARELRRRLERKGHRVEVVDFLDAVALHIGPFLRWYYEMQLKLFPWTYEVAYRLSPLLRAPAVMVDTLLTRHKLRHVIKEFRPDTIVSVYPLASLVLGRMRRKKLLRVPVVTYLTDFAVHSLWVHRGVDRHLAVSDLSARTAESRGGHDARARGPLVGERFRAPRVDRDALRAELGLCPDDRAVLVVAGSWGVGDIIATVEAIGRSGEFHPITVCGKDEKLRAELESHGLGTVIGWTDDMPSLMSAADALVENAGGLTCMEAFAVGLPVVTYLPIAGHGKDNAEMMARAGVNRYAHSAAELNTVLRSVTRPGPDRDAMVAAGYALFVGDPADEVDELARRNAAVNRKGRVVPLRRPAGRRTAIVAAACLMVLYAGLTVGVEAVSAMGVGVAKVPKDARSTVFVGVRLDRSELQDRTLRTKLDALDASVVVDAQAARNCSHALKALARHGVDVANGGWGKGTFLRWNRARNDVDRAGKLIRQEAGTPAREFVPGRRVDAFDQYYSRRLRQKLVVVDAVVKPGEGFSRIASRKVYLIDGRGLTAAQMERAVTQFETRMERAELEVAPLGELR
jgi:UDP-N-acetylglucosamine:LPS N-acetylglucosamine transferase